MLMKLCCFNYWTSPLAEHLFHSVQVMCANVLNSCSLPWDRTVKVWDLNTGEETVSLGGHKRDVVAVRFCTRTQRVFSASQNLVKVTVNLWPYSVQVLFESLLRRVLYIWGRFEELRLEAGFRFCGVILVEASNTSQEFTMVETSDILARKRVKDHVWQFQIKAFHEFSEISCISWKAKIINSKIKWSLIIGYYWLLLIIDYPKCEKKLTRMF